MLRNDIDTGNHGFSLRLVGTVSNPLGLGAQLDVRVAGLPDQRLWIHGGGNLRAAGSPMAFVGLGTAEVADEVVITWPSGIVQRVAGLEAGTMHTVREPEVIRITPPGAWNEADGSSQIVIEVIPHDDHGVPDPTATVSIELDGAAALGPITQDGATWTAIATAPGLPRTDRVTVTIDGTPLIVRPRVAWR